MDRDFTIAFDPIGYFTPNPVHSRIVSLKDAMIYNYIKNFEITDEQISAYYLNQTFNYTPKQIDLYQKHAGYLIRFLQRIRMENACTDLRGYTFLWNGNDCMMSDFTWVAVEKMKADNIPIYICNHIINRLETCYKKFTEFFYQDYDYRHKILVEMRNVGFLKPDPTMTQGQKNLINDYFNHGFDWLDDFSKCIEHWKWEYNKELNDQIMEGSEMLHFFELNIENNEVKDYKGVIPLAVFKNIVLENHTRDGYRFRYFHQNFFNINIFRAKIGGKSILQWYGRLMFDYKKEKDESQEILNHIAQYWKLYFIDIGYEMSDVFEEYLKDMVRTELSYLPARIEREQVMKQNARLKVEISKLQAQAKEIKEERVKLENKIKEKDESIANLNRINASYDQRIQTLDNENTQYETEIKYLRADISNNLSQQEVLKQKLKDLEATKTDYINANNDLQDQIDLLKNNKTKMEFEKESLENQKTNLQNEIDTINEKITELNTENETLSNENTKLTAEVNLLTTLNTKLQNQLAQANKEKAELQQQIDILKKTSGNEAKINELLEKQKQINEGNMKQVKEQLNKFSYLIPYNYADEGSIEENINQVGLLINELIDEKNEKIAENNLFIKENNEEKEKLKKEKATLESQFNDMRGRYRELQKKLKEKINLIEQLTGVSDNITGSIKTMDKNAKSLRKERKELEKMKKEHDETIAKYQKLIKENEENKEKLNELIEQNNIAKAKLEKDRTALKKQRDEYEKKEKELNKKAKELERERKKLLGEVEEEKKKYQQEVERLKAQINKLLTEGGEFVPLGVDPLETSLIQALYNMPLNPDMSLRTFRELFVGEITKRKIKVQLPKNLDDIDQLIYTKSIRKWYSMYLQRIKNKAKDDFNPEGMVFDDFRKQEFLTTSKYLEGLVQDQKLLDFQGFKLMIIKMGIKDEQQKAYFLSRLNHARIGEAIIGDKSIEQWFAIYLSAFFGGFQIKYEMDKYHLNK